MLVVPMLDVCLLFTAALTRQILPALAQARDSERLSLALSDFTELVASVAATELLVPHFSSLVGLLVSFMAAASQLADDARQSAIELLASVAETGMADETEGWAAVVQGLVQIMTEIPDDAQWGARDEDEDDDLNYVVAETALDRVAQSLSHEIVLGPLLAMLPGLVRSSVWQQRHAGLSAIAVVAEGASEGVIAQLPSIAALVFPSIGDQHPRVRYATLYAIAQLCSDLEVRLRSRGLG